MGKQHGWNRLEVLAIGDRIQVACNGRLIVDWRDPEPERIRAAPIGLQLHSNTEAQEVHFREIALEAFPAEERLLSLAPPARAPGARL